ncbi:MAG TPA: bifunctional glycosyltransferase family 2 protein/CDP-glycerol:glycerophosphate glycerophosphotransferase [Streptosporangiaceae bacterium]
MTASPRESPMPSDATAGITVSLVLPVHNVEAYLPACLDAIIGQPYTGFEVIAIDDASPDGCGRILDDYAARDDRIRVVHLTENGGLGAARDLGLERARGEYVWFVDSDDLVTDGALAAIAERVERSHPDVLLFDYARELGPGHIAANPWAHLLREPPPPESFALRDRPSALGVMMTAWNKVIRRAFLLGLGLTFGRGYYEDVAVTYPILLAAERIGMLDRVCYVYRERRAGAITTTPTERHFAAFGEYARVFAFLDDLGEEGEPFRAALFDRMIWHYTTIIEDESRVPSTARRRFFRRMSEDFRGRRPHAYGFPPGARGTKFKLVERDAYALFRALGPVNRARVAARGAVRRLRRTARTTARRARSAGPLAYYQVQKRLPMDDGLAVYAAYWFRGYSCNPRAVYEKARELAPGVRGVWVVRPDAVASLPAGVDHVVPGSRRYLRAMARAKYLVNNVNFPHAMSKRPGSVHLQTQHGTPLKAMGLEERGGGLNADRLRQHSARWDYVVSANPLSSEVWRRVYPGGYDLLEVGYPRDDRLVAADPDDVARTRADLGIAPDRTAVLYAPTFRDRGGDPYPLDPAVLAAALGPGHVLLVRAHYFTEAGTRPEPPSGAAPIVDVSAHPVVEDLCLAADILVTDYSSIMFDYAHLDRPIVIYAPDWDAYRTTRGVTFDLLAEPPGAVATTEAELVDAFRTGEATGPPAAKARTEFRHRFCAFDDGHAAEAVVRRVFLGEPPA